MNKTVVSIVMSTYNDNKYLKRALDGVLKQTFTNWEFVIIDDASSDNTSSIVKTYAKSDSRFVYIKNKENRGLTKNLNTGIQLSRGKYIARADSDDEWNHVDKLKHQVSFLERNPEIGLIGCFAHAVDTANKILFDLTYPSSDKDIRKVLLQHNCFIHSSIVIRKDIIDKVGGYNNNRRHSEDYELYLHLGRFTKFHNIPKTWVNYRLNPQGLSRTQYSNQISDTIDIMQQFKDDYPGYHKGLTLWRLRKLYPVWLRDGTSRRVKQILMPWKNLSNQ